jgi:phosphate uptake regulator
MWMAVRAGRLTEGKRMSKPGGKQNTAAEELRALERHLISLAELVESIFADSVVALMEGEPTAACEARLEDYRVHKAWLQADSVCVDLLVGGELDLKQIQFVSSAIKMAMELKLAADEANRIAHCMRQGGGQRISLGGAEGTLSQMVTLVEGMLGDAISAFVSKDGKSARGLHLVMRELNSQHKKFMEQMANVMPTANKGEGAFLASIVLAVHALATVGEHVMEFAGHVGRLYPAEQ